MFKAQVFCCLAFITAFAVCSVQEATESDSLKTTHNENRSIGSIDPLTVGDISVKTPNPREKRWPECCNDCFRAGCRSCRPTSDACQCILCWKKEKSEKLKKEVFYKVMIGEVYFAKMQLIKMCWSWAYKVLIAFDSQGFSSVIYKIVYIYLKYDKNLNELRSKMFIKVVYPASLPQWPLKKLEFLGAPILARTTWCRWRHRPDYCSRRPGRVRTCPMGGRHPSGDPSRTCPRYCTLNMLIIDIVLHLTDRCVSPTYGRVRTCPTAVRIYCCHFFWSCSYL